MVSFLAIGAFLTWGGVIAAMNLSISPEPFRTLQAFLPEIKDRLISGAKVADRGSPRQLPRSIDGKLVEPGQENPWLIGVMIENLASASVRPQSGLSSFPIVYETLAEGGITRFLALFIGEEAREIGPVRSARPYYVEIAEEYDALYDHAGGSPQALSEIIRYGVHDLNAIGNGSRFHWRDRSKSAPHNLSTSSEKLQLALRDFEFTDKHPKFEPWIFKDEAPLDQRGENGQELKVNFSSVSYQARFVYDRDSNTYGRFHGETEHKDANTDQQIRVNNVIVQKVAEERGGGEKGRILLNLQGEGEVLVFRDGQIITGNWKKADRNSRTKWFDAEGKEIPLNRGHSWVIIVPEGRTVEYSTPQPNS